MLDDARLDLVVDEFLDAMETVADHQKNCERIVDILGVDRFEGMCANWVSDYYYTGKFPDTRRIVRFVEAMEERDV